VCIIADRCSGTVDLCSSGGWTPLVSKIISLRKAYFANFLCLWIFRFKHGFTLAKKLASMSWVKSFSIFQEPFVGLSLSFAIIIVDNLHHITNTRLNYSFYLLIMVCYFSFLCKA
jgi:hypothetical protein